MKYLLDTNICIYIIKRKPSQVIDKFKRQKTGNIAISSISVAELYYGVYKSLKPDENMIALQEFLAPLERLEFNNEDALAYGKIRSSLESKGSLIGAMDMLIASQALSRDLVLITNNEKEFNRIEELLIENWVK
ncbi:MAG: type II toxin-antitoxin system VapC family toxin [Ignavibacteriales bacterium]|nr:MAG: type II toxin-antitoxin system VapC family toxin [Ignavibacteriales bacterium]